MGKGGYSQNYNEIFQIFTLLVHTTLNWESNCIANIVLGGGEGEYIYGYIFKDGLGSKLHQA